ncbi:MAG: PEP-CTERM sorting domain-containing protein [Acidobacteriaceae bacterium]|jgi:hypothetical protein
MKNIGKLAVLGAVLAASSSFAFADTIALASYGSAGLGPYNPTVTGVANTQMEYVANDLLSSDTTGCAPNTYCETLGTLTPITNVEATELNPDNAAAQMVWTGPITNSSWVGINANAGPYNTTNPQYGFYEFTTMFTAVGGPGYSGSIDVLADDTTEVLLNGQVIVPFGTLGGDNHCADNAPTCLTQDVVALNNLTLNPGTNGNTLEFIVEQAGNTAATGQDPSGVDFTANLTTIPEPSSLMMLGSGLVGAAGMLFRRRRQTV